MAFLIDKKDTLNEGILDSIKNLGKNALGKIKDKIVDVLSEKIKYYTENSLEKVIGDSLDDEIQGQVEDDITDIFTSALDSMFNLGESEDEFDAEGDRYEELRSRLLGGGTMKYEEMEELLAAAKARSDQRVVDALKNVVDDPPTDAVTESNDFFKGMPVMSYVVKAFQRLHDQTGEVFFAFHPNRGEKQLFIQARGDKTIYKVEVSPAAPGEQAYWEKHGGFDEFRLAESNPAEGMMDDAAVELAARKIKNACGGEGACSVDRKERYLEIHADPSKDWTAEIEGVLAQYPALAGWKVSPIGGDGYVAEPAGLNEAELSQDDLDDIADMFAGYSGMSVRGDSGYRDHVRAMARDFLAVHRDELKQVFAQPSQAEGFGDFSRAQIYNEDGEVEEKEELLPDSVVCEAVETLRRMY